MKRTALILFVLSAFAFTLRAQAPQEKWATVDGNKVRYTDAGDARAKEALVFVHCWTCNADFWRDNANAFPQYRVITLDLPGHGRSDKPKIEYTMDHFAKAVDAVMSDAGVRRAVLVGHSMGTPIIRRYYELYPRKTLGLVIVDGALVPFGPRAEVEKFFEPLLTDYRSGGAAFIGNTVGNAWPSVREQIRTAMLSTDDFVATSAMKNMIAYAYAENRKIEVPVLAVMAPSPYWPQDMETQYRGAAPNLEFQMWPGVSHFLHMERPKEFNGQVKSFIVRKKLL